MVFVQCKHVRCFYSIVSCMLMLPENTVQIMHTKLFTVHDKDGIRVAFEKDMKPISRAAAVAYLENKFGENLHRTFKALHTLAKSYRDARGMEKLDAAAYKLYEQFRPGNVHHPMVWHVVRSKRQHRTDCIPSFVL